MAVSARAAGLFLAVSTVCASITGCGSPTASASKADVTVVASTDVWGDIASTVGGPGVKVTSFLSSPDQNPHSYEASSRNVLTISEADVVIENGGGYDDFMGRLVAASDSHPAVLDAVEVSGVSTPSDGSLNEHIWYDLQAAEQVATRMAAAFGDADPAHVQRYLDNARAFAASVEPLVAREAALRRRLGGLNVGVTEPVPLYMLDAIGVHDLTPEPFMAAVETGDEVSVSVLDETLKLYTEHRVAALVYNEQTTGVLTDRVLAAAKDSGTPAVGVTETLPEGTDYVSWMADNLDRLDSALSSG